MRFVGNGLLVGNRSLVNYGWLIHQLRMLLVRHWYRLAVNECCLLLVSDWKRLVVDHLFLIGNLGWLVVDNLLLVGNWSWIGVHVRLRLAVYDFLHGLWFRIVRWCLLMVNWCYFLYNGWLVFLVNWHQLSVLVSSPGLSDCSVVTVWVSGCMSAVLDFVAGAKVDSGVVGLVEFVSVVIGSNVAMRVISVIGVLVVVVKAAVAVTVEASLVGFCCFGITSYTYS